MVAKFRKAAPRPDSLLCSHVSYEEIPAVKVCRAFKKLPEILRISREIAKKPYKIIILKGKSAQEEVDNALKQSSFEYKLFNSMTDNESKVLIIDVLK